MYDFAYTQAPASLEGVVMGLSLIATGLGNYVASALVSIVNAASSPGELPPSKSGASSEGTETLLL